jgi:replicative DNA helicase
LTTQNGQAILSAEDFYLPKHRIIFTAIKSVIAKDQHPDPITLTEHLQAEGNFETIGGANYLSTLIKRLRDHTASASNLLSYARIIRKHSLLRQKEGAYNNRRPATEIATIAT